MTTQTDSPRFFRGSSVGTPVRGVYFFFVVSGFRHPGGLRDLTTVFTVYCIQYSTVQYSTVQYSTVQYSTVQYSTVQYSTVQYSTVQYSTVQYSTVQYSTVQYSTVQYSTVQYSTVQYSTVQYSTVQYSTVQYSTVQYSTVQYSTVQYSTVQYSTVQYSTVQYSTVQYSTVQYSTHYMRAVHFFSRDFFLAVIFSRENAIFGTFQPIQTRGDLSQSNLWSFSPCDRNWEQQKKSIPPSSSPRFLRGSSVGSPYPLNHTIFGSNILFVFCVVFLPYAQYWVN